MEKLTYTKYEVARILGARALQVAMNAPLLIDIKKEKLEELNYDPLKIAEIEFNSGLLPITVRRPLPQREEAEEEKEEEEIIVIEEGETKPVEEEKKVEVVEEIVKEVEEEQEEEAPEVAGEEI
jgi:DNA-directed RNA polymerase subunit K/omega